MYSRLELMCFVALNYYSFSTLVSVEYVSKETYGNIEIALRGRSVQQRWQLIEFFEEEVPAEFSMTSVWGRLVILPGRLY